MTNCIVLSFCQASYKSWSVVSPRLPVLSTCALIKNISPQAAHVTHHAPRGISWIPAHADVNVM